MEAETMWLLHREAISVVIVKSPDDAEVKSSEEEKHL